MPPKRKTRPESHVPHQVDLDPLPAPLTTANLLPRYRRTLRSSSRASTGSQIATPSSSWAASNTHSNTLPTPYQDSDQDPEPRMDSGSEYESPQSPSRSTTRAGSTRPMKRLPLRRSRVEDSSMSGSGHGRELRANVRRLARVASDDRMNISAGPEAFGASSSGGATPAAVVAEPNVGLGGSSSGLGGGSQMMEDPAPTSTPIPTAATTGGWDGQEIVPSSSPVTSPSLARILNMENVDVAGDEGSPKGKGKAKERAASKGKGKEKASSKGKGKAKATTPEETPLHEEDTPETKPSPTKEKPPLPEAEPLAEYTCPICFFPPTNATMTPCGHICCGACLFTAVKSTMQRGMMMRAEDNKPKCPVCRAELVNWDGKGGGVIGLKPRAVFSFGL